MSKKFKVGLQDTAWHIGYVKMKENDSRRDKRNCEFYTPSSVNSCGKRFGKCIGSSHCPDYNEIVKEQREFQKQQQHETAKEVIKVLKIEQRINQQAKLNSKIKERNILLREYNIRKDCLVEHPVYGFGEVSRISPEENLISVRFKGREVSFGIDEAIQNNILRGYNIVKDCLVEHSAYGLGGVSCISPEENLISVRFKGGEVSFKIDEVIHSNILRGYEHKKRKKKHANETYDNITETKLQQSMSPKILKDTEKLKDIPFQSGDEIIHPKYGQGIILSISLKGNNIRIQFTKGIFLLSLKASLEKIKKCDPATNSER